MNLLRALSHRHLSETYLLNFSQVCHMLILAGLVPWLIGVEQYGHYAALVALPALFQSAFEAFCVALLSQYRRPAMLRKSVLLMALLNLAFAAAFFVFFAPMKAAFASLMVAALFTRSYMFASAITSGGFTHSIVRSELLTAATYLLVLGVLWWAGLRDELLPIGMVLSAGVVVSTYLRRVMRRGNAFAPHVAGEALPHVPWGMTLRIATSRAFEDGSLTLSPLLLALTASPTAAGQFRIFASFIKAACKLFPFRYEVVMRDVLAGKQALFPLTLASIVVTTLFAGASALACLIFYDTPYLWLGLILCAAGAVASSIALYPVTCAINKRVPITFLGCYLLMVALTLTEGVYGFTFGFIVLSYAVLVGSLRTIRQYLHREGSGYCGPACTVCGAAATARVVPRANLVYASCSQCGHCSLIPSEGDSAQIYEAAQQQYYSDDSILLTNNLHSFDAKTVRGRQSIIAQHLARPSTVVEVGPGAGHMLAWLTAEGHAATAIEQAPALAESLEKRFPGAIKCGEFEAIPLAPESMDAYCSFHVIEHVRDPLAHLKKAFDVVKPGGYAFIATPNARSLQQMLFQPLSPNFDIAHLYVFSPASLTMLCTRAGWQLRATYSFDEFSGWGRVLSKGIRRIRGEDEEATAGKYAASDSTLLRVAAHGLDFLSAPLRYAQAKLGYGNEVFLVLQKPADGAGA